MKILLILAHPDQNSFNHAIALHARTVLERSGHAVVYHDLYRERFDPILPAREIPRDAVLDEEIRNHCDELVQSDGIIIVHPNWWGQPPAILTGWIDRVVRPGVAYRFIGDDTGEGVPEGLLKARAALVINTANTSEFREKTVFGDPLERIWRDCVFGLCGIDQVHRMILRIVVTSTEEERKEWIRKIEEQINILFPSGG